MTKMSECDIVGSLEAIGSSVQFSLSDTCTVAMGFVTKRAKNDHLQKVILSPDDLHDFGVRKLIHLFYTGENVVNGFTTS